MALSTYKEMRKATIKKTRLKNKYLKNQGAATRKAFISQKNLCVFLVRKAKWDYHNELDHKKLTDKTFWKTVKPVFTDRRFNNEKILLTEEVKTITEKLNNFFTGDLNIPQDPSVNSDHIEDPIIKSKEKCKNHQSIKLIKASFLYNSTFSFDEITIYLFIYLFISNLFIVDK